MIKALIFLLTIVIIFSLYFFSKRLGKKAILISYIILFSVLIAFSSVFFLLDDKKSEKIYFPPKFDGEKIIPGYFDEKN